MCRLCAALWLLVCFVHSDVAAQNDATSLSPAAQTMLQRARQLLRENDPANAVILLESQITSCKGNAEFLQVAAEAYRRQFERLQRDGKLAQATQAWEKLQALQIEPTPPSKVVASTTALAPQVQPDENTLREAESAFVQGQFAVACRCFEKATAQGVKLTAETKERFAYCKLYQVADQLNAKQGKPGEEKPQLEREVRAALELAPRLEFGNELLKRLQPAVKQISTSIKHLDQKEQGWSVAQTEHFRVYHNDQQLAEQVAQIAETTRAAVIRKWLGQDSGWQQPCQIYVHPTADSYHRQSGMPATAPGHSDYDADKSDASIIHYRRVFVRADHAHMLTAILPHEVTHVVLNGQFGRKLLPRWADEGMAVLSEPYSRIAMHLTPLPQSYQEGRALTLQELFQVDDYPSDRSKVASFYGQSVCLVEYLTSIKGPQGFVSFMRDANREGEAVALQRNFGLTVAELESKLQQWIVTQRMPTLLK